MVNQSLGSLSLYYLQIPSALPKIDRCFPRTDDIGTPHLQQNNGCNPSNNLYGKS